MTCPLCRQRKARRFCPALSQDICSVCCGTKRRVEIRCPDTCGYLQASRHHPAAVEQRQHQQDLAFLVPTMRELTERQQQLFFVLLGVARSESGDPLQPLFDEDVADAAGTLAATYETVAKGVIYEHRPQTLPAQRLVGRWRTLLDQIAGQAGERVVEREAPWALRAIERGAREAHGAGLGGGRSIYLELVTRMLGPAAHASAAEAPAEHPGAGGLILPPG